MEKEIEKKYTFWERLKSDKPTFFKRAQIFGAGLITLSGALTQVHGISAELLTVLVSVGTTIAALAQFAVKQCEPIDKTQD